MERKLKGSEKKYLRGLAHALKPIIQIGKEGLTGKMLSHIGQTFLDHELIKIRFNEFREEKKNLAATIEEKLQCEMVGMIGNVAIFYREHAEEEKRKLLPMPR